MNTRWFAATFAAFALQSCELTDTRTTERGTNDETSSFVLQDGRKASNATVTVFPAGGTDTLPTTVAYTNTEGRVKLSSLPRGYYSLLVSDNSGHASFVDSVYSDGVNVNLPTDTLRPTGSIKGRIKVQIQDDPKIAWVALVGEGHFHNIDNDSGTFVLSGVPAGKHTLVGRTDRGDYTSTFRTTTVASDSVTDLGTIELVYTGLPIVTGIVGIWDSLGGMVNVKWDASTSTKAKGYRVYRSTTNDPSGDQLLGYVDSGNTSLTDTLFSPNPMDWTLKGLTAASTYVRYRVTTIGQNGSEGDKWNAWSDTLRCPLLVAQLPATWTKISSGLPSGANRLDTLPGALIAFGRTNDSTAAAWISSDLGKNWSLLRSESVSTSYLSPGLDAAVSFGGSIIWTRPMISGRTAPYPYGSGCFQLIDSFQVFQMDGRGRVDSTTIQAKDDSITSSRLILDSAGVILLEGPLLVSPVTSESFLSVKYRLLRKPDGSWIEGDWASWYNYTFASPWLLHKPVVRTVSVTGKVNIYADPYRDVGLDLDSLLLTPSDYSRPSTPNTWHAIQGAPPDVHLTSIVWFDRKIFVLGGGTVWNLELP